MTDPTSPTIVSWACPECGHADDEHLPAGCAWFPCPCELSAAEVVPQA